jgi:hypothetical protein
VGKYVRMVRTFLIRKNKEKKKTIDQTKDTDESWLDFIVGYGYKLEFWVVWKLNRLSLKLLAL